MIIDSVLSTIGSNLTSDILDFISNNRGTDTLAKDLYRKLYSSLIRGGFALKSYNDIMYNGSGDVKYVQSYHSYRYKHCPYPITDPTHRPYNLVPNLIRSYITDYDSYRIPVAHHDLNFILKPERIALSPLQFYVEMMGWYITKPSTALPHLVSFVGYYMYYDPRSKATIDVPTSKILIAKNKPEAIYKLIEKCRGAEAATRYVRRLFKSDHTMPIKEMILSDDKILLILEAAGFIIDSSNRDQLLHIIRSYLRIDFDRDLGIKPMDWNYDSDSYDTSVDMRFIDLRLNYLAYVLKYELIVLLEEPQIEYNDKNWKYTNPCVKGTELILPTLTFKEVLERYYKLTEKVPIEGICGGSNENDVRNHNLDYEVEQVDSLMKAFIARQSILLSKQDPNLIRYI